MRAVVVEHLVRRVAVPVGEVGAVPAEQPVRDLALRRIVGKSEGIARRKAMVDHQDELTEITIAEGKITFDAADVVKAGLGRGLPILPNRISFWLSLEPMTH